MNWINKILNVRPKEWSRILLLSLILVLSNVGTNWGTTAVYAAFLKQAGLKAGLATLIWVLFLSSVLSIPVLSIYTAFVDRIDNNRLFAYIIIAGGGIILLSMALIGMNLAKMAFPLLYVLSQAWLAIFNPHLFTYINDLFDIQSAKRVLPLILATGRVGAAIAGFSLKFLTAHLSTAEIIWIWFLSDVLVVGIIFAMSIILSGQKNPASDSVKLVKTDPTQSGKSSYLSNLKEGWNFTLQSNFLRWMAVGTLLLAALVTLLEYYANKIMAPQFKDYAGFLGQLDGISNLIALVILLFGISRMTKAWGIGNTSLTFPVLGLFICGGLVSIPTVITASFAHIHRKGLRFSLQAPIEALLYNAIPIRMKGRARAFVGGLLFPLGAMVGVAFLLAELWYGTILPWLVPSAIAVFAIFYLISAFMTRHQYTRALVKMLEEEDYSFLLSEGASELVVADQATLQRLRTKLENSSTHEMRIFMTQLIAQVGGSESLAILIPAIKSATEARTRAAMLNVTSAAGLRGNELRELYVSCLTDADGQVRQAALSGLEQLLGTHDTWLQEQWLAVIHDTDAQVAHYALKSLASAGQFYKFESAVQKLDQLRKSASMDDKKKAIDILGSIDQPRAVESLLEFVNDPNDQIRFDAILNFEKISPPLGSALDAKILETAKSLLNDPVSRARQAALTVIGKFKGRENYPALISALADKNPQVRAAAVDILVKIGKDVIPAIQAEINSSNSQIHKMAAVVLSRINPRQFGQLIDQSVSDNLNNIYANIGMEQALTPHENYRSVRVLLSVLREHNNEWIDEILYLLTAIHNPQVLQIVGESLHSDSSATRNLALEALESLTSPQTAALIASLFEPSLAPAQLLQLGQGSLHIEQPNAAQALKKLISQTDDNILFLLAIYAMGDMGAALSKPDAERGSVPDFTDQITSMLNDVLLNPNPLNQQAARDALEKIENAKTGIPRKQPKSISLIERMIILKEVPFFRNIPSSQLETMAMVCEEKKYEKDMRVFRKGDLGGGLYIVVDGKIGIEQEKRGGSTIIGTVENDSYFGEMSLFDNTPRSASAIAMEDSLVLELNRAPVTTLTMQNPDLALELINMLSQRIRETSDRLAETTRSRPRELHKLFDQFSS